MKAGNTLPDYRVLFERQRRNLVAATFILAFLKLSGAKFDQFVLLGNKIVLDNPGMVEDFALIAIAYWTWRYYQYLLRLEDSQSRVDIENQLKSWLRKRTFKDVVKRHEVELAKRSSNKEGEIPFSSGGSNIKEKRLEHGYAVSGTYQIGLLDKKTNAFTKINSVDEEFVYAGARIYFLRLLVSIKQTFSSYKSSEYLLPILMPYFVLGLYVMI